MYIHVCVLVTQLCLTPCGPMDCSPLGSSVLGILQARILAWVAIPFSQGSAQPRSPALQADSLPSEGPRTPLYTYACTFIYMYIHHIYLYVYTCIGQVCIYASVCLYACMCACIHMHRCTQACYIFIWVSLGHLTADLHNSQSTQMKLRWSRLKGTGKDFQPIFSKWTLMFTFESIGTACAAGDAVRATCYLVLFQSCLITKMTGKSPR